MNVKLIGTTHLMSKEEIDNLIRLENPNIIGVELCNTRLNIMVLNPIQEKKQDDSLIGKISKSIKEKADKENIVYGSDQINASKYAIENKIPLILVDRDIIETRSLMEKIPSNELEGFMKELSAFEQMNLTESSKNINENEVLIKLKTNYPVSYEFLIASRELYILNNILKTIIKYPNKKIVIILGKGHVEKLNKELDNLR